MTCRPGREDRAEDDEPRTGCTCYKMLRMKPVALLVGIFSAVILGSCGLWSGSDTQRALSDVDQLLKMLDDQSKSWQATLQALEDKTARDVQSTIRVEVDTAVQRAIAATGSELRCNIDFMKDRLRQHLMNIKARLLKQPETPLKPMFCEVVPSDVDERLSADQQTVVSFIGYDMDIITPPSRIGIFLVDNSGKETDVTDKVTHPTHYLMTLNISPGSGVHFEPTSDKLVLRWGGDVLSTMAVLRDPAVFKAGLYTNAVGPSDAPMVAATVPSGYRLIGGGCYSDWQGAGQLLTASYPAGNSWVCGAKSHVVPDNAPLTAYALYIPDTSKINISVTSTTSGVASDQPNAKATVPPGYSVIGGGCQTSWKKPEPGNLLVSSFPVSDGWVCSSKAHSVSSPAILTSYVIGIKSSDFTVVAGPPEAEGPRTGRNSASSTVPTSQGAGLVGGGCKVTYGGPGQMLTKSYPDIDNNRWTCESKDHQYQDPATITAYSFGLRANRN